ncbi:sulfite exporter TauE/SafE family protein [Bradyrhizobium sp. 180]|uniref:sulfite exporter TauE/SafE family protein n=1 Tax=unclassified Bradyrhizobium TaxID=2631580 RepID=UPI001FF9345A|nr:MULTISPECIES: sulfite exporter TauE/SafE family protein [unclassified Bradyrhizobium]MCK1489665.1 sulfite exporter TauE/SafE family protein [Bradyrhizobium sp. 180]MCK1530671.1 sulfite exporter TauE/SafE family protein [Bradyrhizobium sp. 182]MCK1594755.1 sulfite exporter TauE/SafE family protein [Bradyrhizobium sp. 164]MCK1615876.1 sulfite exporter TauE/SafE family protein [Bradyrhizobium sp. 159]MCK1664147.1 sulfite exporter TauE/SafE family protein [Bradyrhizobium sp. 153]
MDVLVFTVFALAALVGGFVSGFSGFAMGLVVSGVWLHIITPIQTATLIAGYGLLTQGYGMYKLRHVVDLRKAWPLALGTVIGIPIGVGILAYLDPVYLRFGVGLLLLVYSIYGLTRPVFAPMKIGTGADIAIGISNGMLGGLTGLGGVISTISCQWRGWPKDVQRAVFQPVLFVAFVVISLSQAAAGTITKETLMLYVLGVPFMVAGLWSGFKLFGMIDDETFRKSVLALLLIAGLSLIASTLPFSSR